MQYSRDESSFGIAAMICGILSVVFFLLLINIPLAAAAIILGIMQLVHPGKKTFAVIGIACAVLSILLMAGGWAAIIAGTARSDPAIWQQFQQEILDNYYNETL